MEHPVRDRDDALACRMRDQPKIGACPRLMSVFDVLLGPILVWAYVRDDLTFGTRMTEHFWARVWIDGVVSLIWNRFLVKAPV